VAPNPYLVSSSARAWEAYDAINCYFKDGVEEVSDKKRIALMLEGVNLFIRKNTPE
jgi:hypothetical protein